MNCCEQATAIPPISAIAGLFESDVYHTEPKTSSTVRRLCTWNSAYFYSRFLRTVQHGAAWTKRGEYTRQNWFDLSCEVVQLLEQNGGELDVAGLDNLHSVDTPVVLVSNHMSVLETVVLPCLVLKHSDLCITLKEQLFGIPVFGSLLKGFRTISVSRTNPIDDYKKIMSEGSRAIAEGYSVLIFPQSTRTTQFSAEEFNTVGAKLAKRASAPIVPIALKTDFWGSGRIIKDFGPLSRDRKIYFRFGQPITVASRNGRDENQQVIDFIQQHLAQWQ